MLPSAAVLAVAMAAAGEGGAAWLRAVAEKSGLQSVTSAPGAPVRGARVSYVPVTLSGFGPYEAVEAFVAAVQGPARQPGAARRPSTVERLTLSAIAAKQTAFDTPDAIRVEAIVHIHAREPPPDAAASRGDLLTPLVALALEFDAQDVGVTEAVLGDTFRISGYKLLPGSGAFLLPILEASGLELNDSSLVRDGACDRFELMGRTARPVTATVADSYRQPPRPGRLFDDGALCAMEALPAAPVPIQGTGTGSGTGPLTLRLRDMDPVEVLRLLHDLTAESFVMGEDLTRRVTVELTGVGGEDALRALEPASVRVSPPARLRGVSTAAHPRAPERRGGDPMSLSFVHEDLRDILVLFEDITGLDIRAPEGDLGRVSAFVHEVPWEEVLYALLDSAGFAVRAEGERRLVVERDPSAAPPPAAPPEDAVRRGARLRRRGIPPRTDGVVAEPGCSNAVDVDLAGLAHTGTEWRAVLHRADGHLLILRPGYVFCDGSLEAVDGEGITLRRGPVALRVPLPAP